MSQVQTCGTQWGGGGLEELGVNRPGSVASHGTLESCSFPCPLVSQGMAPTTHSGKWQTQVLSWLLSPKQASVCSRASLTSPPWCSAVKVPERGSSQLGMGAEPKGAMSGPRMKDILFSMAVMGRSAPYKALNTRFGAWGHKDTFIWEDGLWSLI